MTTKELIDVALTAATTKTQTAAALAQSVIDDNNAGVAMTTANKDVHDDVATNGQALYIGAETPPVYSVVSAVDPDTFALTPIRVA